MAQVTVELPDWVRGEVELLLAWEAELTAAENECERLLAREAGLVSCGCFEPLEMPMQRDIEIERLLPDYNQACAAYREAFRRHMLLAVLLTGLGVDRDED